jgi:diguanylate cyclase (GGDEF)-like protein
MFLDLDRFKIVNDSLGHPAGDQLLMDFAGRIRKSLRASDTVARLGGDEFAVIVERVGTESEAAPFAERILECLAEPFILQGRQVFTSASIGIALYRERYTRRDDMVRDADAAMYRAKSTGRGRYAFFDTRLHSHAMRQLDLDSSLRHAVESAALEVHYQPIVRVAGGSLAGFEALVRWPHPEQGFISPAEFIPLAEETGLIYAIGLFVLRSACTFLKTAQGRLAGAKSLTMSVNLSGVQFLRPELLGQIDLVVRRCGVDPRSLKLEITESVLMEHAEFAEDMMAQMKAQNLSLSIDDFGTGYSSMKNLRRYPVDTVKLDQSFVQRMLSDPESLEIVRGSVAMAHRLGLEVVAEGIESAEQRELLEGMGCDYGQGFLFARALEPDAALDLVVAGKTW